MKIVDKSVREPMTLAIVSIVFSVFLALIKLITGAIGRSSALISDGVNSLGDIVGYSVVAFSLSFSQKKADRGHPYGHEKVESVVSLLFSLAIIITGGYIGYSGVLKLFSDEITEVPTMVALIGAVVSLIGKGYLYFVTRQTYKRNKSSSLKALSLDHFSDALATTGALAGVILAKVGLPFFDPLASILIAVFVIVSGYNVLHSSLGILMDVSADQKTIDTIEMVALNTPEVKHVDLLKTRMVGSGCYVDIEICCSRNLSLEQSHLIAENVHDRIEKKIP
ncbi:MAG: cation diffusion facilitator family transporter, partial [Sphaerochaetaceae bacterium]